MAQRMSKNQESIDNAFLFLLTSLTLLFGVLNDAVDGLRAVLLQIPLIISGFFFPFYIGYVRGVIDPGSNVERVRGWIFFTFGVATYAWMFTDFRVVCFRARFLLCDTCGRVRRRTLGGSDSGGRAGEGLLGDTSPKQQTPTPTVSKCVWISWCDRRNLNRRVKRNCVCAHH